MYRIFSLLLLISLALSNCAPSGQPKSAPEAATPQSDLAALGRLIRLEEQPISAQWLTESLAPARALSLGPSDWQLIALLTYDEAALSQLKERLAPQKTPSRLHVRPDFVREWFPQALRAHFQPDGATGNLIWQGARYQPTPFLKPPLGAGFVLIAEPYILIVLHTL